MARKIEKPSDVRNVMFKHALLYLLSVVIVCPLLFFIFLKLISPLAGIVVAVVCFIILSIIFFVKLLSVHKKVWSMADDFYLRSGSRKAPKKKRKK